ncbi:hypothetical protein ALO81_102196 [Pseudomonas cannabina]|uniref:Uncharacterized protein n=1 Tax=Pseudomonas cannabina TaxID=86840 RepID=A0A0P9KZ85_PSECA|nr:hypothetical protein ALO81_102196 [Pseudomonas cannabina]
MHQVTVAWAPTQQPSPRRVAPSAAAMSLAWEGFSQRNSRMTTVVEYRCEAARMDFERTRSKFYLYGYTDKKVSSAVMRVATGTTALQIEDRVSCAISQSRSAQQLRKRLVGLQHGGQPGKQKVQINTFHQWSARCCLRCGRGTAVGFQGVRNGDRLGNDPR